MIKYVIEYMNNIKRVRLKKQKNCGGVFRTMILSLNTVVGVGEGGIKLSSQPRMQMQDKVHAD